MKWFISDTHFGHEGIIKFGHRPFESVRQMDRVMLKNINKSLSKGDILYHLGDLAWTKESYDAFFAGLRRDISFVWLEGNHDRRVRQYYKGDLLQMKEVKVEGQKIFLCHYPMLVWPGSHYNSWHLYGHIHTGTLPDGLISNFEQGKMFNVNVEYHNFCPISELDVAEFMALKEDNWDLIKKEAKCQEK